MISFVKKYFKVLRESDDKTIHTHSLAISIIISVITISFVIYFFGKSIFDLDNFKNLNTQSSLTLDSDKAKSQKLSKDKSTDLDINKTKEIPSPFESLKNIWNDASVEFFKKGEEVKSSLSEVRGNFIE